MDKGQPLVSPIAPVVTKKQRVRRSSTGKESFGQQAEAVEAGEKTTYLEIITYTFYCMSMLMCLYSYTNTLSAIYTVLCYCYMHKFKIKSYK